MADWRFEDDQHKETARVFGERLMVAQEFWHMSNRELSQKARVGCDRISRWRSGEQLPNSYTLKKLAVALNASTDWLLGLRG